MTYEEIDFQFHRMVEIMRKARIKYTSLKMVDGICVEPQQETQSFFDKLISDFRSNNSNDNSGTRVIQMCKSRRSRNAFV